MIKRLLCLLVAFAMLAGVTPARAAAPAENITVNFALLGDHKHAEGETEIHTQVDGNLEVWIPEGSYEVAMNATVWDLLESVLAENNMTVSNTGNYISSITRNGVSIGQFTNGAVSGWMYTINGVHSGLGVEEQVLAAGDRVVFHYTDDYVREEEGNQEADQQSADAVEVLIAGLGEITLESEGKIAQARAAYNGLYTAQKALVENLKVLEAAEAALIRLKAVDEDISIMYETTGGYLEGLSAPGVGATNGEWRVLGLARAGRKVSDQFYKAAVAYVQANMNADGRLHTVKSTDNSRMILALTAIGKDVTDVGGYNLLSGLDEMTYIGSQGINGVMWALIAFDSHCYEIPAGDTTRDSLINTILNAQNADGGWALGSTTSDPDITGMALQALAPHYGSGTAVAGAVDKALNWLSAAQKEDGSFSGSEGVTSESIAQVITALTALRINPDTDPRFVKNGQSALDALAAFYVEGGGFRHSVTGERNVMATEQGYYALVSYYRLIAGKTSLYDMSDVTVYTAAANQAAADAVKAMIENIGTVTQESKDGIEQARKAYEALTRDQKNLISQETLKILTDAEAAYAGLTKTAEDEAAADAVEEMIAAIGSITQESRNAIEAARSAYEELSSVQKSLVENLDVLLEAERQFENLEDQAAAQAVDGWIQAIGIVTETSEDQIKKARAAYESLTDRQKELVEHLGALINAETALKALKSTAKVTLTLYGCYSHGSEEVHTMAKGNLDLWIGTEEYKVLPQATVGDVLEMALEAAGMTFSNPTGNYVESINGLGEFTNGSTSGWMYTLNGAYSDLGVAEQTVKNGDDIVFHYTDDYTKERGGTDEEKLIKKVEELIEAIGTVTVEKKADIAAARDAYDALTDEQKDKVKNYGVLLEAEERYILVKKEFDLKKAQKESLEKSKKDSETGEQEVMAQVEEMYGNTGDYLESLGMPGIGSVGGEWMVIGLVRSGREIAKEDAYWDAVQKYVQENADEFGRLHRAKSTENSRMILALTALGKDVRSVGGHDLLAGLNEMEYIKKQGINGPIWALIAFDSGNYSTPEGDVSRKALLDEILDAQLSDGGWSLSGEVADPDMTGMALQALAAYYGADARVKAAVDQAVEALSSMQKADGSFGNVDGISSESIAQVIVALSALGIDAGMDERFVKEDGSVLSALYGFYVEDGGFKHTLSGDVDGMATEQGYYALTAYTRMLDNKNSLYDMTDVIDLDGREQEEAKNASTEEPKADDTKSETSAEVSPETETSNPENEKDGKILLYWWVLPLIYGAGIATGILLPKIRKKQA